jgi:hypothetical protein
MDNPILNGGKERIDNSTKKLEKIGHYLGILQAFTNHMFKNLRIMRFTERFIYVSHYF